MDRRRHTHIWNSGLLISHSAYLRRVRWWSRAQGLNTQRLMSCVAFLNHPFPCLGCFFWWGGEVAGCRPLSDVCGLVLSSEALEDQDGFTVFGFNSLEARLESLRTPSCLCRSLSGGRTSLAWACSWLESKWVRLLEVDGRMVTPRNWSVTEDKQKFVQSGQCNDYTGEISSGVLCTTEWKKMTIWISS